MIRAAMGAYQRAELEDEEVRKIVEEGADGERVVGEA
jgi:hypothetical protein